MLIRSDELELAQEEWALYEYVIVHINIKMPPSPVILCRLSRAGLHAKSNGFHFYF